MIKNDEFKYKNKTFAIVKDNNQKKSGSLTSIIINKIKKINIQCLY